MRTFSLVLCGTMLMGAAPGAAALEFSQRGSAATLSGGIRRGDGAKFEEFMARPEAAAIRVAYLNSGGGSIGDAMIIARSIRRRGIATVADGRTRCESACTLLFAAGTRRHYVNTGALADRLDGKPGGLGFHEGNNQNSDGRGTQYSGGATASMINGYYEFGASAGSQFAAKAGFRGMYRISGQTALSSGFATSLSAP